MGKILILTGSPRKGGNTDMLAKAFADGASANNTVEIVSVADYRVNPCIGCNYCFQSDGNKCFQKDDMCEVYDKMAEAETLVIASPIYFYGISSQLKAVIDRLHTPLRKSFSIKNLALLLVAASDTPSVFEPAISQYNIILDYFKLNNVGVITVGGVFNIGDIAQKSALNDAFNLGASMN